MAGWVILTGEYPPKPGGVSDYTRQLARALVARGDQVHVFAPEACGEPPQDAGVKVHRLPGRFDRISRRIAAERIDALVGRGEADVVLVQWVPTMYGQRSMNLGFCYWLRQHRSRWPIWIFFHEVAFPITRSRPLKENIVAMVNRPMVRMLARASRRNMVSIPGWGAFLEGICRRRVGWEWMPVPSTVPVVPRPELAAQIRSRYLPGGQGGLLLGHFGSFGELIAREVERVLPGLLERGAGRVALLLGRGSDAWAEQLRARYPALAGRIHGSGSLAADDLASWLAACDLLIQPYPDGISTRRTSTMAPLAAGCAVLTTQGLLTEPFWSETEAVCLAPAGDAEAIGRAAEGLLGDAPRRQALGARGQEVYAGRFSLERHVAQLIAPLEGPA